MSNYVSSGQQRGLRACMVCSIVMTQTRFRREGCPNCEEFLELAGHEDAIQECTSQVFEGLITLANPSASWVARWQRLEGYVTGVYAVKVTGIVGFATLSSPSPPPPSSLSPSIADFCSLPCSFRKKSSRPSKLMACATSRTCKSPRHLALPTADSLYLGATAVVSRTNNHRAVIQGVMVWQALRCMREQVFYESVTCYSTGAHGKGDKKYLPKGIKNGHYDFQDMRYPTTGRGVRGATVIQRLLTASLGRIAYEQHARKPQSS